MVTSRILVDSGKRVCAVCGEPEYAVSVRFRESTVEYTLCRCSENRIKARGVEDE